MSGFNSRLAGFTTVSGLWIDLESSESRGDQHTQDALA